MKTRLTLCLMICEGKMTFANGLKPVVSLVGSVPRTSQKIGDFTQTKLEGY